MKKPKHEKQLREEVEKERKAIRLMDEIVKEKHTNLELHENKLIELKRHYEQKLKHIEGKEKELSEKELQIEKRHKEISHTANEKRKIEKELSGLLSKKEKIDKELLSQQKRIDSAVKKDAEVSKELDLKVGHFLHYQKEFEQLFKASKLLDAQNKANREKLGKIVQEINEKERHIDALEKKLRHMSQMDKRFEGELENHKLSDVSRLLNEINRHISKKDPEGAKGIYDGIRQIYSELKPASKARVYRNILKAKDNINRHTAKHQPRQLHQAHVNA